MWKFSNLNSGYNHWPPDVGQKQLNLDYLVFSNYGNTTSCFCRNSSTLSPVFGDQGSPLNFNSDFISPPNFQNFQPGNCSSGLNASTATNKFLIFDHSGDKKSVKLSSVANPFQSLNPTLPSSTARYPSACNSHGSDKQEEMHEDTEEIDALLYSDSELSLNSEEGSTGHSPLNINDEEITTASIPAKRRKLNLNHAAMDESLIDTASSCSARASNFPKTPSDDNLNISYVDNGIDLDDKLADRRNKEESIETIIRVLRRIIPSGDAMDAAAVLDEAILYLKSLKLQATSLDVTTESI